MSKCESVKPMSKEESEIRRLRDRELFLIELFAETFNRFKESETMIDGTREHYAKCYETLIEICEIVRDTDNSKTLRKDIKKVLDKFFI